MLFQAYARWVVRRPKTSLLLAFVLMLVLGFLGKDVRLNNHFAVLFAIDNDNNAYREFYRQVFGADDGLLIAILQPQQADEAFFAKMEAITRHFEQHPDYVRTVSPTNTSVVWSDAEEVHVDPLFVGDDQLSLAQKLQLLETSPTTAQRLVSADGKTFTIIAEMPVQYDRYKRIREPAAYYRQYVEDAMAQLPGPVAVHFAGIAYTRIGILKLMMQDLLMLVPLTSLVIGLFTLVLFRRFSMIVISFLTTLFGVLSTVGVMGLNHDDINQLTMTFPVLLMVIVVANGIHFFHRYFRELEQGKGVEQAVMITAEKISKAAFLSCFTTMIGFYALMMADMKILRSFGLYLGTGVLLSYIGMILIIPAGLLLAKPALYQHKSRCRPSRLLPLLQYCTLPPGRTWVSLAGVLSLLCGGWLGSHADYDYYLKDMLDKDHPQVVAANILDAQMSGALPVEISLLGQPGDFRKAENLQKMDVLGQWLSARQCGENTLNMAAVLKSLNQAISGNNTVPETDEAVAQLLLLAEGSSDHLLDQLATFDYSHARIKASAPDLGAVQLVELQQEFQQYADKLLQGTGIKARMTGEAPVAYEGMNRLTEELLQSVMTALVFIVLTILLVFRDWRLAIGSIFPNILPIVLGLAFYALSGQSLNPLPGIAFCIAIGIAVDDTVHLFARFNEERQKGTLRRQAILNAVEEVKGALISSSVILTAGFLIFLLSGFTWNRDLGWLGAFLIITALLADLVFTPAVLSFGAEAAKKRQV